MGTRPVPAVIAGGVMGELGVSGAGLAAATAMCILASRSARCRPVWPSTRLGPRLMAGVLLAIATAGLALTAAAPGPWSLALGQFLTAPGCSGVCMAGLPVTALPGALAVFAGARTPGSVAFLALAPQPR
jgi:hypothetical protein